MEIFHTINVMLMDGVGQGAGSYSAFRVSGSFESSLGWEFEFFFFFFF